MLEKAGKFRLSAAFFAMAVSACGGPEGGTQSPAPPPSDMPIPMSTPGNVAPENNQGVEFTAPLLSTNCTLTATNMAIAVADGETAYFTLRASDSKVVLNALTSGMAACEIASTGTTITVTASGTAAVTGRTVILDYINGYFHKAIAAATPLITIDFSAATAGTSDNLKIRGSSGNDSFAFGAGTMSAHAFNLNAGSASPNDTFIDVTFKHVEVLTVNGGDGNDTITGAGTFGTTPVYARAASFYGGAGNDILTGGSQGDTLYGGSGDDTMDGAAGNDTYNMGTAEDGADTMTATGANPGSDTVDYSGRTAALTIKTIAPGLIASSTDTSGGSAGVEGDKISDTIPNIIGGSANDTITILSTSTVAHTVTGGRGNDTFTGGTGPDVFDGGLGADVCLGATTSMTYANRTHANTITMCEGDDATCAANNNDGGQSATNTTGVPAESGTASDNRINVTMLSADMTGTVGRLLRLTGFTVAANDDNTTGYPITAVNSSSSVTIDVSGNSSFDQTDITATTTLTWTLVAEGDNVRCANVIGGSAVDTITGDTRANTIKGGAGNDVITAGTGDDTIHGEGDNDTIYAGAGSDTLVGGEGNDNLYGGDGDDILQGDAGTDNFYCDGLNASGTTGTDPGPIDFTVDVVSGTDTADTTCN